jgi:hypothetical protein
MQRNALEFLLLSQDDEDLWRMTVVPTDDEPSYVKIGPEPDLSPDEMALLQRVAQVAAVAHAPFIESVSPKLFEDFGLVMGAASGLAAGIYQLFKARIDAKNGRKLKLKVGDIEVEPTGRGADANLALWRARRRSSSGSNLGLKPSSGTFPVNSACQHTLARSV